MAMPTYGDDHGHRRAHPRVDASMLGRAGDGINHGGMRRRPVVRASATYLPGIGAVLPPERLDMPFPAWQFSTVSTRIFLISMTRFAERVRPLAVIAPPLRQRIKALLHGNPPHAIRTEAILSAALRRHDLHRVDMLGSGAGSWTLHPPNRTADFFAALPALIARVEAGDIPEAQRGEFDVRDALVNALAERHPQSD
jgi:hypothetical protein